jgi:antitoxin Phd
MIILTSAEAQNNFGKLLDTAQREPVTITRHGRTAAYVVSQREIDDAEETRARRKRAVSELAAWREKYADQISPEAAKLTDEDIVRMVHEARDEIARGL